MPAPPFFSFPTIPTDQYRALHFSPVGYHEAVPFVMVLADGFRVAL